MAGWNQCKRCGHEWEGRTYKTPVQCPKCKSPYWDKERVRDGKTETSPDEISGADTEQRLSASGLRVSKVSLPVASKPGSTENVSSVSFQSVGGHSEDDSGIDLCGFRSYNQDDGEWYLCGKEKGHGIKHGEWVKE